MVPSNYQTATETQALLLDGKTTIDQILKDHRIRYEQRNDQVKAWACVDMTKIPSATGVLTGVMIGIKDIMQTYDFPTEHGSPMYKGSPNGVDAAVVALLRHAGACMIGKTAVNEFAIAGSDNLLTGNPFDTDLRPGTSSAGSAATVSDYQCHVTIGSQTGASVTRPASYCGVFGFKPTWGLVSLEGIKPLEPSINTIGIFGPSISDIQLVARVLRVVADPLPDPGNATLENCRFGFVKTELFDSLGSSSLKEAWEQAKNALGKAGATVEEVDLGGEFKGWEGEGGRFDTIINAAASVACLREYTLDPNHISSSIAHQVKQGIPTRNVAKILDDLSALRPIFDQIAQQYDAIIAPSSLDVAPNKHDADTIEIGGIWSGLHVPAISIPGLAGVNGLPIGLTMVTSRYDDGSLLRIAKLAAEVFIRAGEKDMRKVPAPEGVVHLKA